MRVLGVKEGEKSLEVSLEATEKERETGREDRVGRKTKAHLIWKTFDDDGDDGSELLGSEMRVLGQEFLETDERVCRSKPRISRAR